MYKVEIDFDQASKEWRKNKKYLGNGIFEYKCLYISGENKNCKNKIYRNNILKLCKYHLKKIRL